MTSLSVAALVTSTLTAHAADTDAPASDDAPEQQGERTDAPSGPPLPKDDDDEPEPPLMPPALDTVAGHLNLGLGAMWVIPFANLESGQSQGDVMGSGPGVSLDLGYGVSRSVALGVFGQGAFLGEGDKCRDCSTTSYAFGAFIRYHLVQGVRFDPWMSAGIGYRLTSIDSAVGKADYSGIEWLRLSVGGDWYAFDKFAVGPFMELDLGRYTEKSPGGVDESANHWQFATGVRVVFDLPGK
jgi:hypothetical protein